MPLVALEDAGPFLAWLVVLNVLVTLRGRSSLLLLLLLELDWDSK
jgi:hypothetical protein